mmetsp:Transcript_24373/g.57617  ORF Transcript_24373/g.57617 Transcript_24373/m.57617 type:complete len:98 (+) Transcript_24373:5776-6069(+)
MYARHRSANFQFVAYPLACAICSQGSKKKPVFSHSNNYNFTRVFIFPSVYKMIYHFCGATVTPYNFFRIFHSAPLQESEPRDLVFIVLKRMFTSEHS